ncbi:MAG: hypothetical protein M1840_002654 [Geoglossum simile]|nr:MAG: hypothetical protein M1840_002654 [Geoglossum simile]
MPALPRRPLRSVISTMRLTAVSALVPASHICDANSNAVFVALPSLRQHYSHVNAVSTALPLRRQGIPQHLDICSNLKNSKSDDFHPYLDIAITVLTEVIGVYPTKYTPGSKVVISAGADTLGYGKDVYYESRGILSEWNITGKCLADVPYDHRWCVESLTEEPGALGQHCYTMANIDGLAVGKRVRVAPSQGSDVGRALGWYYVVDSGREGKEDEVVDIWVRWRDC